MAKREMLILDSQKLELNIPFREIYDFASATLKKIRYGAAKKIILEEQKKGREVVAVALDSRTAEFFEKNSIPCVKRAEVVENLYDLKYGEISFEFLRSIIKKIGEADPQATYRGILLPDLDEKNLWRTFALPAVKAVDTFSELIRKYRPREAIILNRAHFWQKLFMLTAKNSSVVVSDRTGALSALPWKAKEHAIKNFGFVNSPRYLRNLKPRYPHANEKTRKKIIIAHDTISAAKILPWAKKLSKKYEVIYVGVKESGEEFEKAGIKYRKLQDYATETAIASAHIMQRIFRKDFEKVFGNPELREVLYYRGIDLSSALEEMFWFLYYISYPILVTYIELFSSMLAFELPDLVVTVDDRSRFGKVVIAVAKRREVKTLIVQHGALLNHPLFDKSKCTKFAAYGEQTKKILRKRGFKKEQIAVVGQAEDIPAEKAEKIRAKICTKLNISRKKPIIVFASQALPESVNYPSFEMFYTAAKDFPEVQFIAKLHPDERKDLHMEFIRKFGLENVSVVKELDTKELLIASDLVVNIYSTVGMEALSFGKLLVSLNVNLPASYFPTGNGAYIVRRTKHLKGVISNIIAEGKGPKAESIKRCSRYYIKETGGKACNNVARLIEKMMVKK